MKRLFALCLSTCLLIFFVNAPFALADHGTDLKNQINQLEKNRKDTLNQIQNNQNELKANKEKQAGLIARVQTLQNQIENSNYKIHVKQDSIDATRENIQVLKENIKAVQQRIKKRQTLIAKRARTLYENGGNINYLQLVLGAKSFNDFVDRVIFVGKIAQQDHSILLHQVADKKQLVQDQLALKKTLKQMNIDLQKLKQMKAELDNKKAQEQSLLHQLQDKAVRIKLAVSAQQKQADLLQQQEEAHRQDLSNWQAEQKRKAEERAQAAQQAQATSYSSSSSGVPAVVAQFIQSAQDAQRSTGVPAAITLAQISLESDVGGQLSGLATAAHNLFGIKGTGPAGTIYMQTHEVYGGVDVTITAGFKRYQTYYQCILDHAQILNQPRYQYYLSNAHNLNDYAYGIQDGGYATDPYYAAKLIGVIQEYGLSRYDVGSF